MVVLGALPPLGHELLGGRFVVEAGGDPAGAAGIVADPSIPVDADLLDEARRPFLLKPFTMEEVGRVVSEVLATASR